MFNGAGGKTYYRSNNKEALNLEFHFAGRCKRMKKWGERIIRRKSVEVESQVEKWSLEVYVTSVARSQGAQGNMMFNKAT